MASQRQIDTHGMYGLPAIGNLTEIALHYERALRENEKNPTALIGMGLVALASRQFDAAIEMARAAVDSAPTINTAWLTLGQALKAAGKFEEAKHAYREAMRLDGSSALAHLALGELLLSEGSPEQAIRAYEAAIRRCPAMAGAHLNMGNALAYQGRDEEALACYERALGFAPKMAEAEFGAGFVQARLGRPQDAKRRYRRALTLRPDFAAAWMNLGCLLRDAGQDMWAEAALQRAIELCPDSIGGWINLSLLKRDQRRMDEAASHLRRAFALDPKKVDTYLACCQLCAAQKDLLGAWAWLRWATTRDPENAEAVNMQGVLLHMEGRYAEAIEAFEHAAKLGCKSASSNRGNSLMDLGRMEESLRAHEVAVGRDPRSAGARYNLALVQLRLGDWENGWANYEARWRFREVHRAPMIFRQLRWRGEALDGKRILLYAEQGLGDAIQFCRYAPLVAARGGSVILQVHEPVAPLARSLAAVRAGAAQVARLGVAPPDFDLECPLMSLPAIFGTTVDTVPWTGTYLNAQPELKDVKRNQFDELFARGRSELRVGLAWAGNPKYKADARRSMKLATLTRLLRSDGVAWVSLQKGEAAEQLKELPEDIGVWDGSSRDVDLAETAALIALLDLVITTDTCIAHLAGAMGKPVWILLPHLADWRWMEKAETTPWYPTARLFRQQRPGDWADVLERVIAELRSFRSQTRHLPDAEIAGRRGRAA